MFKFRYADGGYGVEPAARGRLDDASVERFLAAVLATEPMQWCQRKMDEPAPEVVEKTRYKLVDQRIRYNASRGVHEPYAKIVNDLGLPATTPALGYSQPTASAASEPRIDGDLLARIKQRSEYNTKIRRYQKFDEIKRNVMAGR